ncbi:MAG TPA: MFS transporter [Frankiaceae bacterium]|nr:MFS transporter [Frankiaceae bacterium]
MGTVAGEAEPSTSVGTSRSTAVALAAICVVLFLTFLDTTVISVALNGIEGDLGAGVVALQWVVNGYALAFAGLMLVGGSIGDILGRRRVMLGGIVVFIAGSVVSALAGSVTTLVAGRIVMGVGAAASEPGTLSMLRQLFPERRSRARAVGAWTAMSGLALALGPVVGGILVEIGTWRAIFWFNLVLGVFALVAAAIALPESVDREGRRLDVAGAILGAGWVTALTYAIIRGEQQGYTSPHILASFAVAVVALLLFIAVELKVADPLVDLGFFRSPTFAGANLVGFLAFFGLFTVFFFTALYLQSVPGQSAGQLAGQFAPMAVAMVVAAALSGRWVAWMGPKVPMAVGCLIAAGGVYWTDSLLAPNVAYFPLALSLLVAGVGFGIALVPVTSAALAAVPGRRSGMAASVSNTSRQLGAVVAIAVLGAIVNSALGGTLQKRLTEQQIPAPLRAYVDKTVRAGGLPSTASVNDYPPVLRPLVQKILDIVYSAFGDGLHTCFTIAAGLLVAGAIVAAVAVRHRSSSTEDDEDDADEDDGGEDDGRSGGGLPSPTTAS